MTKKSTTHLIAIIFALYFFHCNNLTAQSFNYPPTPKQPVTDTIFGKVVTDNYRWMENMNSQLVKDWLKTQADYTNSWLNKIPGRDSLIEAYKKIDKLSVAEIGFVMRESGRYFYQKTMAGENVGKLYYRESMTGKEILLFDPAAYSKDKKKPVTFGFLPSKDGKKVALTFTASGKIDIHTLKVINVDTKKFYTDSIYPVAEIEGWKPDSKGIIYIALQTADQYSNNLFQDTRIMYHALGTSAKEDKIILSRKNNPGLDIKPANLFVAGYSMDNKYIMATIWIGSQDQNKIYYAPESELQNSHIKWKQLVKPEDQVRDVLICNDNVFLLSHKDAPKFKVLMSPLHHFDIAHAQTVIPESSLNIQFLARSRDYLFINKTDGINTFIDKYNFTTEKIEKVNLPFTGSAWLQGWDAKTNNCYMYISSWNQPSTRYEYNAETEQMQKSTFNNNIKYPGIDELMVEEVEVTGHDGTMIPLSIVYNKNVKKDGTSIVFMTGYGSYGNPAAPYFNTDYLPLLNKGVIIAITHPRGGGEKGYEWHMGGFKATKPNTWKDFISSAEYLISKGYTSPNHLIGEGTSAGGILIGRAMTERPDLFASAINNVPVSNPLRGENRPNGILDSKEFGTVKDSAEAMGLIEMDAYLHVKKEKYPAVIAVTGINDTRVPSWQPSKFIAALQSANTSDKPILLIVNYDSGHWSDEKYVNYRNLSNMYALALWQAGHKDFQPVQNKP